MLNLHYICRKACLFYLRTEHYILVGEQACIHRDVPWPLQYSRQQYKEQILALKRTNYLNYACKNRKGTYIQFALADLVLWI